MAAADLISPSGYYQTFDEYKQANIQGKTTQQAVSDQELRANYNQAVLESKSRTRDNAQNQIIKSLGFIVIPLPIFLYFNRARKRQSD